MTKIKVMVVDDSAFVRQTMSAILNSDRQINVIATAADPVFAAKKISKEFPDVITLDLEMPRMDGLTFLKKLMAHSPVPVVVISSLTEKGSELMLKALEYGAVDVLSKPKIATKEFFEESKILICDAVKAAAQAKIARKQVNKLSVPSFTPKFTADKVLSLTKNAVNIKNTTDKIVAIGASTGGTVAIENLLNSMPVDCPGIVIVQHMPEVFTRSFADRLNLICRINVSEAVDGDLITSGKALIAPGNKHMMVTKNGARYSVVVNDGPLVNRHRPSVDVLFRSAANCSGINAVGIILTGMGDDGAKGLLEMKNAGAYTIAQDENSCIVFGMPKVAIELGAASTILPLEEIARHAYGKLK